MLKLDLCKKGGSYYDKKHFQICLVIAPEALKASKRGVVVFFEVRLSSFFSSGTLPL